MGLESNCTLTSLDLWFNRIGDQGAERLAAALESNSTLTSLQLEANDIGDQGAARLAAALERNCTILQSGLRLLWRGTRLAVASRRFGAHGKVLIVAESP